MDDLFSKYSRAVVSRTIIDQEAFLDFFQYHQGTHIDEWLKNLSKSACGKSDVKARELKKRGDEYFENLDLDLALENYTKALAHAQYNYEAYGQILHLRSKVHYENEDYDNCIVDSNRCLETSTSDKIKLEAYALWIKCLCKTNRAEEVVEVNRKALRLLEESTQIADKEILKCKLVNAKKLKPSAKYRKLIDNRKEAEPEVEPVDGFNQRFLYASSAVSLSYDEIRGRHVVANKAINAEDILFVEKAFVFAPIFINEDMDLQPKECYHCLRNFVNPIPCKNCIQCLYCNEVCQSSSWTDAHQWECRGMQIGLWYCIGIGFPAFKALLKGSSSLFKNIIGQHEDDVIHFGSKDDNYPYFAKLVSNLSKMDDVIPCVITAIAVIRYLQLETGFFDQISENPGVLAWYLTNHIAQFQCNSSSIRHNDADVVACGIFPSISMMNHSCKPNISISYHRDTAIVRAAENINKNGEIFNCYGVDYRFDDFETRQQILQCCYFFVCKCEICKTHSASQET